jgi:hypothetical protein
VTSTLSIREVTRLTGLSPSVLRQWQNRYGWPNPCRSEYGYRRYSVAIIPLLQRMAELRRQGVSPSELIVDGVPDLAKFEAPAPKRPALRQPQPPTLLPESKAGQDLLVRLVRLVEGNVSSRQIYDEANAFLPIIPPADRHTIAAYLAGNCV